MKIAPEIRTVAAGLLVFVFAAAGPILFSSIAIAAVIPDGTLMVSTGNGKVTEYTQDGVLITQLDTGTGSHETAGSGFDSNGNFFVTSFQASAVTKFDPSGAFIGPFGSGYDLHPESVIFAGQNVFIGQADGSRKILKFDASGNPFGSFAPATESRGTDWIALAGDGCTMFYTSEGQHVKRYDVCRNTQLPDFNTAPLPDIAYAFKLLPGGGLIVADTSSVIRLDGSGNQVQTYTIPNIHILFALNLDPDMTSFWTADYFGEVYRINIASGAIEKQWSATSAPGFVDIAGLAEKDEIQPVISGELRSTAYDVTAGDGVVRLINPATTSTGVQCAMVYVFDAHEEMQECCGCPVTSDGLRVFSTRKDLIANPLTGIVAKTGVIQFVTTAENATAGPWLPCDAATSYSVSTISIRGWTTHTYALSGADFATENEFLATPLNGDKISALLNTCAQIHTNGTGHGLCICGTGDDSAPATGSTNR